MANHHARAAPGPPSPAPWSSQDRAASTSGTRSVIVEPPGVSRRGFSGNAEGDHPARYWLGGSAKEGALTWTLRPFRFPGDTSLEGEKRRLHRETPAVADQMPVAADDTVTRNDDRQGILAVGGADGPEGRGAFDPPGQLAVRHGLAV